MGQDTSKFKWPARDSDGAVGSVDEALAALQAQDWKDLAKLAEYRLRCLRVNPSVARYLAGITGEEIVNSTVLAVEIGAATASGRKVHTCHLESKAAFVSHFKGLLTSIVDNLRRHPESQIEHFPVGFDDASEVFCNPIDPTDLSKTLATRDLFNFLLPLLFQDLRSKPKQLAVLQAYSKALNDAIMPTAGQSKFVRFCVRSQIRKRLRQIAAQELGIKHPTGKEMLP
jgi:hypothetical protein